MTILVADSRGRFLADLKKIIALHGSFGIDSYPMTDDVRRFFKRALPGKPERKVIATSGKSVPSSARKSTAQLESAPSVGASSLAEIRQQLGDCTRCDLHKGRGRILFGRGSEDADLFIVGEYPNSADDAEGALFSGPDGDLLGKMLGAINLEMEHVYIASVVKCRASAARPPTPGEAATCLPFLTAQIEAVSPRIICAMGTLAAHVLLKSRQPLIRLRGRWRNFNGIPLMATFHPLYLLKKPEMKKATWLDLQAIQHKLQGASLPPAP